MKTTLTLEIEYEIDGEMPPIDWIETVLSISIQESMQRIFVFDNCTILINSTQEV